MDSFYWIFQVETLSYGVNLFCLNLSYQKNNFLQKILEIMAIFKSHYASL